LKTKIAINTAYGGFGLSPEASEMLNELKNIKEGDKDYVNPEYGYINIPRYDKDLIKVIETLGEKAYGDMSEISIYEVEGPLFRVEEYDGYESLVTPDSQQWDTINTPEAHKEYPELFL